MEEQNISTEQNLERRLNELESIVGLLEDGSISINEAIAKYSEGMKLALECRKDLNLLSSKVAAARAEALESFSRLAQEQKQEQDEWQARAQQRQGLAPSKSSLPNNAAYTPQVGTSYVSSLGQANLSNQGSVQGQGAGASNMAVGGYGQNHVPQGLMSPQQGSMNGLGGNPNMQGGMGGRASQIASGTQGAVNGQEQASPSFSSVVQPPADSEVPF